MSTNVKDNVKIKQKAKDKIELKQPKNYCVILHNNHTTAHDAVIDVLRQVFNHSQGRAIQIMMAAEQVGYSVCMIAPRARCEEKKTDAEAYCAQKAGEPGMGYNRMANYEDLNFEIIEHDDGND